MLKIYILIAVLCSFARGDKELVCEHSTLNINCPADHTIEIQNALYGRITDGSTCPHKSILTTSCRLESAEEKIRAVCQHKNSCSFPATNSYFGHDPCYGTYKYAEVHYICKAPAPKPKVPRNITRATFCEHETVNLSCPEGKALKIMKSTYGRANANTCPGGPIHTTDCDLLSANRLIRDECHNQKSCSFQATNSWFQNDPCVGTFKYVTVRYKCYVPRPPRPPRPSVSQEQVCEHATLSITCPEGKKIRIKRADYGRSDGTTCPHKSILTTNCHLGSALGAVKARCNNHNSCSFPATNGWFGHDPCYGTYKYATVDYVCWTPPQPSTRHHITACADESVNMDCIEGQEIHVTNVVYGRRKRSTCPSSDPTLDKTRCVLPNAHVAVSAECGGKKSCSFSVNQSFFGSNPCANGARTYAEVRYICKTKRD